jgi:signal transduction histidine kinase
MSKSAQNRSVERPKRADALSVLMSHAPVMVFELDQHGEIVFASRLAQNFAGKSIYTFIAPAHHAQLAQAIERVFASRARLALEVLLTSDSDDRQAWHTARLAAIVQDDRVQSVALTLTNIDDQKEQERKLNLHAEQLSTIIQIGHAVSTLDNLDNVLEIIYEQVQRIAPVEVFFVCLLNEEGTHVRFPLTYDQGVRYYEKSMELVPNSFVAQVIGTQKSLCIHFTPDEIEQAARKHPHVGDHKARAKSALFVPLWQAGKVMGALSVQSYTYNAYTPDMIEAVQAVGDQASIAIHNARLYMHVQKELIERKQHEAQIEKLNSELEQRVRERTAELEMANDELESFSYSVSHDLRTPLRTILGYSRIVQDANADTLNAESQRMLQHIMDAGIKMNQLIDSLLSFARFTKYEIKKENVDIQTMVSSIIETYATEIGERDIAWTINTLPPAQADPTLLRQVFANLISNAIKYTSKRAQAQIEIGAEKRKNKIIYFVRDNGIGFKMAYANKLFGVFQRLHSDEEYEGIGIGLATVQRIIQRHGGRIWTEAEPEKGATFYFTLGA